MAKAEQSEKVSFWGRFKQLGMVIGYTARRDRLYVPLTVTALVVPLAAMGILVGTGILGLWFIPLAIMIAVLAALIVLNSRSQTAMLRDAEGQPGAAASILESIRGDWRVHKAISATTQYDMVHLVIGRCGVVMVGEGNPQRVRSLISQERRRLVRVIGNADLRDFVVGNDEGQVPLGKLRVNLMRLPRTVSAKDVNSLDKRIKALSARPQMPKGAIPKNMRPSKGAQRSMRGR